ncbi:biotin--[acetyl-CoA-carboxylase] ligase [Roseomonas marmotae]|uniref:biotin--[biotin carboxyl-carrier protein] ligase n=1 Tax=Roseomonas marmotae TaxID=2768161 RepID=A0ABS3K7U5_9PROT|nr:biotin--[acetyl-CoA-carboxylase] ligase [Roseomonas marmotae]MBO1073534.1 biotin--[acetyl-CoA-carboxylase] ligase [Roseomonas marmotae]QTI80279.1 biotin--[acetyl-CoA-carboxylase] ligase [Roseomonas marmotae]
MTPAAGRRPPAGGWRLAIHDELASTQDLVLAAAQGGEPEGLAVLARRQSAGRGTQGRAWSSPEGNLFISMLLRPGGPALALPQWSLLAGVALADTVAEVLPPDAALRLKWPNDLLLNGAKCSGILSQGGVDAAGRIDWVVIGIGVNLAMAPALPDRPTISLMQAGAVPQNPVAFAWRLLASVDLWRARGLAAVRKAWVARGPAPQTPLHLRQGGRALQGGFAGLDEQGRLLLSTPEGLLPVAAGEVLG